MTKIVKLIHCDHMGKGRRVIRNFICSFMVGVFLSVGVIAAYAGVASSVWTKYGPVYGYSYQNRATISTGGSGYAVAYSEVQNQVSANIPTGYMGAKARMYDSSNYLVSESDYRYNDQPLFGMSQTCSRFWGGTYYSKGMTQAWNGTAYSTYNTAQSPSQNH